MGDLSVNLSGLALDNPVIPASGTFGFGYEFAEIYDINVLGSLSLKGTTREPRFGNPTPRIAECREGLINSVGLQNPGVDAFIAHELPRLRDIDIRIIADEFFADEKCLRQTARIGLNGIRKIESEFFSAAEELFKARRIVGRRDDEDIADARQHERGERIVDHRLVVDGQKLFACDLCERIQPRSASSCQNNTFHNVPPISFTHFHP